MKVDALETPGEFGWVDSVSVGDPGKVEAQVVGGGGLLGLRVGSSAMRARCREVRGWL